jgi:hypothetical protein
VGQVLAAAADEVIEDDDLPDAVLKELVGEMRADEAGTPSDQDAAVMHDGGLVGVKGGGSIGSWEACRQSRPSVERSVSSA